MSLMNQFLIDSQNQVARLENRVAALREALSRISTHALCVDGVERKMSDIARAASEKDQSCN